MAKDTVKLTLHIGDVLQADLTMDPSQGATPTLVNYKCTLDGDSIVLEGVPRRADPLQVAVDALHGLGYAHSGRKPAKPTKPGKPSPPVV